VQSIQYLPGSLQSGNGLLYRVERDSRIFLPTLFGCKQSHLLHIDAMQPLTQASSIPTTPPAVQDLDTRPAILLYYAYRPLSHPSSLCPSTPLSSSSGLSPSARREDNDHVDKREHLACWYEKTCAALALKGRVRVAWDGVNATLGELRVGCLRTPASL
jgi:hypothetical protein